MWKRRPPYPRTLQGPEDSGWSLRPHAIRLGWRRQRLAEGHVQRPFQS